MLFQDLEKLNARATRFGIQQPSASQKPSAVLAHVDPEEVERRRKRAERFGLPTAVSVILARPFPLLTDDHSIIYRLEA